MLRFPERHFQPTKKGTAPALGRGETRLAAHPSYSETDFEHRRTSAGLNAFS
jgi:hypothetical protein